MLLFRRLNLVALILCFIVVVVGAYVRLSDAGLGCPDWPGCYGHLTVPDADHEIAAAEQQFPQRPVEAHKAWKEMGHRYLASTLGLLIVGLAALSVIKRREGVPRRLPWVLVALVIFQGVLGMWTVTWQLKPLAVSAHLLGGLSTLALLFWQWLSVSDGRLRIKRGHNGERLSLRVYAVVALALLAVQIFLGGWTSSNYAALACPDLPTCHGVWLPDTDVKEAFTLWRGLGTNYEFGVLDSRARVTIHFVHRLGALTVTAVLLGLIVLLWRRDAKPLAVGVFVALTVQVMIGISIVWLQLPLTLAAAHNAGAALLLLSLVAVNHSLWVSHECHPANA